MPTKQDEWKAKNTIMIGIRIQNSSGIPDALIKALEQSRKTKNGFIIEAIREKLIRDGYMTQSDGKSEK